MNTREALEHEILIVRMKIHEEFPELYAYISEMSEKSLSIQGIDIKSVKQYYSSIEKTLNEYSKIDMTQHKKNGKDAVAFPGYPLYPASEDMYSKGKKEMSLNPEDSSRHKANNEERSTSNEKDFDDDMSGDDLDVPGSELDDQQESVGSEDEENNYYSLGGDNHDDLEEDKG